MRNTLASRAPLLLGALLLASPCSADPYGDYISQLWAEIRPVSAEPADTLAARQLRQNQIIDAINAQLRVQVQAQMPDLASDTADWAGALRAVRDYGSRTPPPPPTAEQAQAESNGFGAVMFALGLKLNFALSPPTVGPPSDPERAALAGVRARLLAEYNGTNIPEKSLLKFAKYLGQNQAPGSPQEQIITRIFYPNRVSPGTGPGSAPTPVSPVPGAGPSFASSEVTINYGPNLVTINGQLYSLQVVRPRQENQARVSVVELVPVRRDTGPNGETIYASTGGETIWAVVGPDGSASASRGGANLRVSTVGGDLSIEVNGQTFSGREVILRQLAAQYMFVQEVNGRRDGIFTMGTGWDPTAWRNASQGMWFGYDLQRQLGADPDRGVTGITFQELIDMARTNMPAALRRLQSIPSSDFDPDWDATVFKELHPPGGGPPALGMLSEVPMGLRGAAIPATGPGFKAVNNVYTFFPTGINRLPDRPPRPGGATAGGGTAGGAGGGAAGGGTGPFRLPEGATMREDLNSRLPPDWISGGKLAFISVGGVTAIMFNVKDALGAVGAAKPSKIEEFLGILEPIQSLEILNVGGRYLMAATSNNAENQAVVRYLDLTYISEAIRSGDNEAYARRMVGGFNTVTRETNTGQGGAIGNYALFQRIAARLENSAELLRVIAEAIPPERIGSVQIAQQGRLVTAMPQSGGAQVVLELKEGGRWVRKDAALDAAAGAALSSHTARGFSNRIPFVGLASGHPDHAHAMTELGRPEFQWPVDGTLTNTIVVAQVTSTKLLSYPSGSNTKYLLRLIDTYRYRATPDGPVTDVYAIRAQEVSAAILPNPPSSIQLQELPALAGEPLRPGEQCWVATLSNSSPTSGAILVYRGNPGDNLNNLPPGVVCRGWVARWGTPPPDLSAVCRPP